MKESKLIRAMTRDGSARVLVLDSTEIVRRMQECHHTAPTSTAALGRLLTAASMLGSMMGEKQDSLTVGIQAEGATGKLIAVSDYYGNVRGYMEHPEADPPVRADGKLDVGAAVGGGILYVIHDTGEGEPQTGMIQLVSGEIAEDIAAYYAESEQIPTVCALGVLVGRDRTCCAAGGILVQLLPFPSDDTVARLESNIRGLEPVSAMIYAGKTPMEILGLVLDGIPFDPFDEIDVCYHCTCSRERMGAKIRSLGAEEIRTMLTEQEREGKPRELTAVCRFCGNRYVFGESELLDPPASGPAGAQT